jgi:hypothetical protein
MASDGHTGAIPVANLVHGSQTTKSIGPTHGSGKTLPRGGKAATVQEAPVRLKAGAAAVASTSHDRPVPQSNDPQPLIDQLNKHLNDSGRPDQFRLDPNSGGKIIQQVNPATGAVIGEFLVSEFPALARGVGASGLLVDSLA